MGSNLYHEVHQEDIGAIPIKIQIDHDDEHNDIYSEGDKYMDGDDGNDTVNGGGFTPYDDESVSIEDNVVFITPDTNKESVLINNNVVGNENNDKTMLNTYGTDENTLGELEND